MWQVGKFENFATIFTHKPIMIAVIVINRKITSNDHRKVLKYQHFTLASSENGTQNQNGKNPPQFSHHKIKLNAKSCNLHCWMGRLYVLVKTLIWFWMGRKYVNVIFITTIRDAREGLNCGTRKMVENLFFQDKFSSCCQLL